MCGTNCGAICASCSYHDLRNNSSKKKLCSHAIWHDLRPNVTVSWVATFHETCRDRFLLAYTFARVGAVVNLKVEDYFQTGKRSMIRFREKGGKETAIPVHHKLEELLDRYLAMSGLRNQPTAPLFPIAVGKTRKLGNRPATRIDAARMLKRRLKDAGLSDAFSPHSFRATGITNFLENGGTLEVAQRIAGHADTLRLGLQEPFSEGMPANRAEGVAIAMEHCSDLRQIEIALFICVKNVSSVLLLYPP